MIVSESPICAEFQTQYKSHGLQYRAWKYCGQLSTRSKSPLSGDKYDQYGRSPFQSEGFESISHETGGDQSDASQSSNEATAARLGGRIRATDPSSPRSHSQRRRKLSAKSEKDPGGGRKIGVKGDAECQGWYRQPVYGHIAHHTWVVDPQLTHPPCH